MKVVFLGTPSIGASALKSLINNKKIDVICVVTSPDKPMGRSHSKFKPSPVAILAEENNIYTIKTNSINKDVDKLKELDFDYILTCAFGQFLSDEVLRLPKKRSLNIHASLLPEGRGGAPIHWSIINGKKETGISIMEMVSKMDAGDYYLQYKINIDSNDTADTLFEKMSDLILDKTAIGLIKIDNGSVKPIKQDENMVTFWMNISRNDAKINFTKKSNDILNKIRGLTSKPGAWAIINNKVVKIHSAELFNKINDLNTPSKIISITNKNGMIVSTIDGFIKINEITIEGEKKTNTKNLINSKKIKIGDKFE